MGAGNLGTLGNHLLTLYVFCRPCITWSISSLWVFYAWFTVLQNSFPLSVDSRFCLPLLFINKAMISRTRVRISKAFWPLCFGREKALIILYIKKSVQGFRQSYLSSSFETNKMVLWTWEQTHLSYKVVGVVLLSEGWPWMYALPSTG